MKRVAILFAVLSVACFLLPGHSFARPVFLKDGSRIEALSVRKSGAKVYVLVNKESQIFLYAHEVDLAKTFDSKWEKPLRKSVPVKIPPSSFELTETAAYQDPEEVETVATAEPVAPIDMEENAPAPLHPQEVIPSPTSKPKPAPRPVNVPEPVTIEPNFDENGILPVLILVVGIAFSVVLVASFWKVFTKAGEAGWKCLVPIYNFVVLLKISGTPIWWIVLFFIPVLNIGASVFLGINLAKKFGKGPIYGLGLCFLSFIFYPHLAFSKALYQ